MTSRGDDAIQDLMQLHGSGRVGDASLHQDLSQGLPLLSLIWLQAEPRLTQAQDRSYKKVVHSHAKVA